MAAKPIVGRRVEFGFGKSDRIYKVLGPGAGAGTWQVLLQQDPPALTRVIRWIPLLEQWQLVNGASA